MISRPHQSIHTLWARISAKIDAVTLKRWSVTVFRPVRGAMTGPERSRDDAEQRQLIAEAVRVYLEPDSQWRLNLIKEIADHINGDNGIALAAIEGSLLDLGQRTAEMRADLDRLRQCH